MAKSSSLLFFKRRWGNFWFQVEYCFLPLLKAIERKLFIWRLFFYLSVCLFSTLPTFLFLNSSVCMVVACVQRSTHLLDFKFIYFLPPCLYRMPLCLSVIFHILRFLLFIFMTVFSLDCWCLYTSLSVRLTVCFIPIKFLSFALYTCQLACSSFALHCLSFFHYSTCSSFLRFHPASQLYFQTLSKVAKKYQTFLN